MVIYHTKDFKSLRLLANSAAEEHFNFVFILYIVLFRTLSDCTALIFFCVKKYIQMKAIKEELGDNDDEEDDLAALERKMQSAGMPQNTWKLALREFRYL
jgi:hypothetical protein